MDIDRDIKLEIDRVDQTGIDDYDSYERYQ